MSAGDRHVHDQPLLTYFMNLHPLRYAEYPLLRLNSFSLILCLSILSGCATAPGRTTGLEDAEFERSCRPAEESTEKTPFRSLDAQSQLSRAEAAQISAATGFSPRSVQAAHAFDVLPLLQQIPDAERALADHREGAKEALQDLRSQIIEQILLVSFEHNSIMAEIQCEEARAEHLAVYLEEQNDNRARLLTIAAIVVGGIWGIVGGALALADHTVAEGIVGIVGGTLTTVFGGAALFQDQRAYFGHPRNLLREIWEGPDAPLLFPDVIWRFLNRPLEADSTVTLRTIVIARWRRDGRLGSPGSDEEKRRSALMFGEGGEYTVDDLYARAQMFNLLQSQIGLTSEYLEQFLRELIARKK
jgi:hypothetical protein